MLLFIVLFLNLQELMSKEMAKINRNVLTLREDQAPKIGASLSQSEPRKISMVGIKPHIPDLNVKPCSDSNEEEKGEIGKAFQNLTGLKTHDACYVDHKLLYELKVEIIARLPCFEYWKLQFLNKKFLQLLKSCEIFRVRQERGLVKPYVILHSGAVSNWEMFDKDFKTFRRLPKIPSSDYCFFYSGKETVSVGTQLIVIGKERDEIVVFRYELENHKWFKGPSMITPRAMYGSASHGKTAFFAGGIKMDENRNHVVVQTVEKYNADTKRWTMINGMHKARKFSSGCFLRGKFYVLGGRDDNDKHLTCGESYDETTDSWELIPDMLKDMTVIAHSQSPPLIAVVDDNLYMLETSLNELRVYDINTNIWKKVGVVPVSANAAFGWGIAFKSMGDRLLVIGTSHSWHRKRVVHSCCPSPDVEEQHWEEIRHWCVGAELPQFIHNCCVMFA
ncbi:F-box/kelch-repeat protein At3g27150-like [Brassica napus]|uniref:F-box/kelch-repeat protein At3g27150-like n=1 Tax=Brassica napus TaxID=3708 RepID=UPI002078D617|nr:F-box/kelch-repeat protein At3g27150-like [Brassica napus]